VPVSPAPLSKAIGGMRAMAKLEDIARGLASDAAAREEIEADMAVFNGPCVNCRWYFSADPAMAFESDQRCGNPAVSPISYDPKTGAAERQGIHLDMARGKFGLCGPEGALYQFSLVSVFLRPLHAMGALSIFIYLPASIGIGIAASALWWLA